MRQPVPFGKYHLLERISVGGMAEVFKAKAFGVEGFEKILAIKRILPSMAEDADFIQMFIDEAKIAGQLNHANIAQIFELGRVQDSHFIAMEYVWGKDVLQIQNRFRRMKATMPFPMAAYVAAKMCEGLDYAHKKKDAGGKLLNIIHRDVSPQNVLVSYDGEVKVIDFGIAKAASRSTKTQAGVLKGKFGYMSPEQVRGLPLDRRSDIFAIATILYELLTAERLFLGESDFATLEKVRNVDVPPPSKTVPGCPEPIEKIILKGLAKDVEDRYQWGAEMQEDLQAYLNSLEAPFGIKQLAAWMREQFAPEMKRESQVLEEQKKMTREMKAPAVAAALGNVSGAPSQPPKEGTMELRADDLLEEVPELGEMKEDDAPLAGEATQISTEVPPEVLALLSANPSLGSGAPASPANDLQAQSTQILSSEHPKPPGGELPSQATMILDQGAPPSGNGAQAAGGLAPLPSQATVLLDAPVYPSPQPPPPRDRTGQTALHPETSQVDSLPYRQKRRSTIGRDLAIGIGVAAAVVGGVLGVRAYLARGGEKATLVITVNPSTAAKVQIDGRDRGSIAAGAALTLKDLAPGPHKVRVVADSGSFEDKVTLQASDVSVVSATLTGGSEVAAKKTPDDAAKSVANNQANTQANNQANNVVKTPAVSAVGGMGKFRLTVGTEGAVVYVDGAQMEDGAWKDPIPLKAGAAHEFRVSKSGKEDARFSVTLAAGEEQAKTVELQAAMGHLEVRTDPPGAEVNVNGKPAGQTPVKVDDVDLSKEARVTIRKHGFKDVVKRVSFKDDSHQSLDVKLASSSGGGSSAVAEEDKEDELAPVAPKKPDEGKHDKPEKKVADMAVKKSDAPPAAGGSEPGFLVANTQPWAKVLIDNKDTGKTTPIAPRSKIPLKPGKHKVTFLANGKKYDFEVVIKAGEDFRLIRQLDAP